VGLEVTRRMDDARVGDNHRGPQNNQGKCPFSKNNKKQTNKPTKPKTNDRGTPRVSLHLTRGPGAAPRSPCLAQRPDAPSGESPLSLRPP
jgi:hypothetical protein